MDAQCIQRRVVCVVIQSSAIDRHYLHDVRLFSAQTGGETGAPVYRIGKLRKADVEHARSAAQVLSHVLSCPVTQTLRNLEVVGTNVDRSLLWRAFSDKRNSAAQRAFAQGMCGTVLYWCEDQRIRQSTIDCIR